ncbi:MAG: ABC transporter substrate-binding protein [Deltaproteobacteria bacterium]|nr:ABC transporter substrate-binding protein [Deltaproteobacteria bacterium]
MKRPWLAAGFTALLAVAQAHRLDAQAIEKAIIAHNSDSISIAPLIFGIDHGFYRKEGIELEFRLLRTDLSVASIVSSKEVDYMYSAGTGFRAAARGLPLKIIAYGFKDILFYLMAQPGIQSGRDLRGKKVAVSSPSDTGGLSAKASIKAFGLDPDKDVVYISIGAASVRMAAMEARSVEAAIMPVPWNIRMKQKGFKELIFAGSVLKQPLTGIVTSGEKLEKNPQQVKKVLRGFLRSLKAFKQDKKEATEFIARKFVLEPQVADEVYGIVLHTLSEDGTVSQQVLQEFLEQVRKEPGTKKQIALGEIVDYRLLREAAKEIETR